MSADTVIGSISSVLNEDQASMQIEQATTVMQAFEKALEIMKGWSEKLDYEVYTWFRGANSNSFRLLPGAYRQQGKKSDFSEWDTLSIFIQEGAQFVETDSIDSWRSYILAQHHGLPTRLLDWSESFSAALFFALEDPKPERTPCIWLLQPYLLNEAVTRQASVFLPENKPELILWLPRAIATTMRQVKQDAESGIIFDNDQPLALYPKRANARIAAQAGTFTVHGHKTAPLDEVIAKFNNADDILARVDLVGMDLAAARIQLGHLGVRRSRVYPDIDNFVMELKERFVEAPAESTVAPRLTENPAANPKKKPSPRRGGESGGGGGGGGGMLVRRRMMK